MTELKKASVKSKVEAVLFSTGHRISLDEISKLCRSSREGSIAALQELRKEYDEKQSSLMLVEDGDFWKFTVRDHFIPMVRKIVTETELTKSILETLAVIAFKYPILQSDLIKLRTNKAYEHLVELEQSGYITRQKHSRTNLIKLTDKFFKYFDLTEEKLKDQFKDFGSIAKAIKEKEEEVIRIKDEQRKRAEDLKKEDDRIKKEIDALDKEGEEFEIPLETYQTNPEGNISVASPNAKNPIAEKEKLGDLEVVATEPITSQEEQHQEITQPSIQEKAGATQVPVAAEQQNTQEKHHKQRKSQKNIKGIKLTPEMDAKAEQMVEEMLHPENRKE
ncbi:SMC-Scp complex subunit ScpB [Candidatus Woesearchaeota archaeon]|nr:SMC-Scp complex subunit ScpB [Candidatus Woesearchaeota archaeon]